MKFRLFFLLCAIICCGFVREARGDIAIIVHKSTQIDTITISRLIDIYTLNSKQWKDGSRISVTDYKGNTELKVKFYKTMKMTLADMRKIWLRKQFSGKAIPPKTLASEEAMVEKIASTPGAVGYISSNVAITEDIRVIATLHD